jgi:hypothetical protein
VSEQSIVLKQQRDLSQIIETAVAVYLQNWLVLFQIAAVVIPLGIASAVFAETIGASNQFALAEDVSPGESLALVALSLLTTAVQFVASTALITALRDLADGRPPEFGHAYDVAFDKFWTLVAAALRVIFHVVLLAITIIGIPWAINRLVRWLFTAQAVVLDDTSAKAALSYSADAVDGSWWRTLGIVIVIGIITQVPQQMVAFVFFLAPVAVSGSVSSIASAALLPFAITAMTLLYLDLRTRNEAAVIAELPPPGVDDEPPPAQ